MGNKSVVTLSEDTKEHIAAILGDNFNTAAEEVVFDYFALSVLGALSSKPIMKKCYPDFDEKETLIRFFTKEKKISSDYILDIIQHEGFQYEMDRIRGLATLERQKDYSPTDNNGRFNFLKWYLETPKECCYCGIKEKDLEAHFNGTEQTKKAWERGRGNVLEIERVETFGEKNKYSPQNTKLACYVCNNAKSDFLSAKDFLPIADGVYKFWCAVLKKEPKKSEEFEQEYNSRLGNFLK